MTITNTSLICLQEYQYKENHPYTDTRMTQRSSSLWITTTVQDTLSNMGLEVYYDQIQHKDGRQLNTY